MASRTDSDKVADFPVRALDALGMAWSTYSLYPDPVSQPAFIRAVDLLADPVDPPMVVVVGPGAFLNREDEIPTRRDGTERLARELFLHDVEALRIRGGVTDSDLVSFFKTVDRDDEEVRKLGGISTVMAEHGTLGIEVFERGLLVMTATEGEEGEDDGSLDSLMANAEGLSPAATAANRGASPDDVAAILHGGLPADDEASANVEGPVHDLAVGAFLTGLEELHGHALPYAETAQRAAGALREGATDPWKGFRTFLEAFFHLPRPSQLLVLEAVLERSDETANQLFLDQLSGADLADYLPEISRRGQETLTAYAVVVGSEVGRPGDEMEDLVSSREVSSARQAVAARISEVLSGASRDRPAAEELLRGLRDIMSHSIDDYQLSTEVLRGLLECEDRDERFQRVLRVWTGRVSHYLRDGDWKTARALLDAILTEPPYDAARDGEVREALERVAGRETLRLMLDRELGSQPSPDALQLVEAVGAAAVAPLVVLLAKEEDGQTRRLLTELLAHATAPDPRALEPFLTGQPWFVVRNLATVLGKTGRAAAVPCLQPLIVHDDHRVRVEALRSLVRLQRGEASAVLIRMLDDPNNRVRQSAATLARSTDSTDLDRRLAEELQEDRLQPDVAVVVVRILASRASEEARGVVEGLAKKRFALKGTARAVRDAARDALAEAGR